MTARRRRTLSARAISSPYRASQSSMYEAGESRWTIHTHSTSGGGSACPLAAAPSLASRGSQQFSYLGRVGGREVAGMRSSVGAASKRGTRAPADGVRKRRPLSEQRCGHRHEVPLQPRRALRQNPRLEDALHLWNRCPRTRGRLSRRPIDGGGSGRGGRRGGGRGDGGLGDGRGATRRLDVDHPAGKRACRHLNLERAIRSLNLNHLSRRDACRHLHLHHRNLRLRRFYLKALPGHQPWRHLDLDELGSRLDSHYLPPNDTRGHLYLHHFGCAE